MGDESGMLPTLPTMVAKDRGREEFKLVRDF